MAKKKWQKPKLIVLVRGEPGEVVLGVCKIPANGPSFNWPGCTWINAIPGPCGTGLAPSAVCSTGSSQASVVCTSGAGGNLAGCLGNCSDEFSS